MEMMPMANKVVPLFGYGAYRFPWGAAIKEMRTGKWLKVYIGPGTAQEIDVSNIEVILHDNGIEFVIGGDLREPG